jgi:hypothetical protein
MVGLYFHFLLRLDGVVLAKYSTKTVCFLPPALA